MGIYTILFNLLFKYCLQLQEKPKGEIIVHDFDLTDFVSIKKFADHFKSKEKALHVLILNAGTSFATKT